MKVFVLCAYGDVFVVLLLESVDDVELAEGSIVE